MLWLVFALMLVLTLVVLLRPLLSSGMTMADAHTGEINVYRNQLRDLDTDLANSLVSPVDAESARLEIQRKLINVAGTKALTDTRGILARRAAIALAIALPAGALLLYTMVGSPDLRTPDREPDHAAAPTTTPQSQMQQPDVDTMVQRLADRLKKNPDDLKGWKMLGWSYAHMDRNAEAAQAYRRAVELAPKDAGLQALYAETLVQAAGGNVTPDAHKAINQALGLDAREPRALYLTGLWQDQQGHGEQAFTTWSRLLKSSDISAEWVPELKQHLAVLATKLGKDVSPFTDQAAAASPAVSLPLPAFGNPHAVAGPDQQDVAAASGMSPEARAQMINGMVAGLMEKLRQNPRNLDGWLMLARSRKVLGDANAARTAVGRAREIFAGDKAALARIDQLCSEIGLTP